MSLPVQHPKASTLGLALRALGVIYGDIGTSPLYVVNTIFTAPPRHNELIGGISLVIWSLLIFVCMKYAIFILIADNAGEGGVFALVGLLIGEKSRLGPKMKKLVVLTGLIGAALLLGDGAFTPPVSVLGAMSGLSVAAPSLSRWVVRITVIILVVLFVCQRFGTSRVGVCFGPVICMWFAALSAIGLWRIPQAPSILHALNPYEAFHFLAVKGIDGFYALGGVFLAITGLEALYADIGHFGAVPIRLSWFCLVFPALSLNYLGQGAMLYNSPENYASPFYKSAPSWAYWPMIVLATCAAIIASQAIITGSYSLTTQAISLGLAPPIKVIHTSKKIIGQIYVPLVNWILLGLCLIITAGFGTSTSLGFAYGVTISTLMVLTTLLYALIIRYVWNLNWFFVFAWCTILPFDGVMWATNLSKLPHGGWVALLVASIFFIVFFCWWFGESRLNAYRYRNMATTPLSQIIQRFSRPLPGAKRTVMMVTAPTVAKAEVDGRDREKPAPTRPDGVLTRTSNDLEPPGALEKIGQGSSSNSGRTSSEPNKRADARYVGTFLMELMNKKRTVEATYLPTTGLFFRDANEHTPHVFENMLAQLHAVPRTIIFLNVRLSRIAVLSDPGRLVIKPYGDNVYDITVTFGYAEHHIALTRILDLAIQNGLPATAIDTYTVILDMVKVQPDTSSGWKTWLSRWPVYLYSILKGTFQGPAGHMILPHDQCISVGFSASL